MILDCFGISILGAQTDIAKTLRTVTKQENASEGSCKIWGTNGEKTTSRASAFLNGCSAHSMDFDDTWHPATHPSSPVLPSIIALIGQADGQHAYSSRDLLTAFNVGVQVQGILLRCSKLANNIPKRFHPPAVVGVMGSAAAAANMLNLNQNETKHALAIAASFAGAPVANAGTPTKPLHCGNSARFGLEAATLAKNGVQGNHAIFDNLSGFPAFFDDFDPDFLLRTIDIKNFVLEYQDVAIKSYPAHLGMHWAIEAALNVRKAAGMDAEVFVDNVRSIEIKAPKSKYIDRSIPQDEHEARHSFQFNTCTALLDGKVTIESYQDYQRTRPRLTDLLEKTSISTEEEICPSFDKMHVEVCVSLQNGQSITHKCMTPNGHWRKPLSDAEVERKFTRNTEVLAKWKQDKIADLVWNIDKTYQASALVDCL